MQNKIFFLGKFYFFKKKRSLEYFIYFFTVRFHRFFVCVCVCGMNQSWWCLGGGGVDKDIDSLDALDSFDSLLNLDFKFETGLTLID